MILGRSNSHWWQRSWIQRARSQSKAAIEHILYNLGGARIGAPIIVHYQLNSVIARLIVGVKNAELIQAIGRHTRVTPIPFVEQHIAVWIGASAGIELERTAGCS